MAFCCCCSESTTVLVLFILGTQISHVLLYLHSNATNCICPPAHAATHGAVKAGAWKLWISCYVNLIITPLIVKGSELDLAEYEVCINREFTDSFTTEDEVLRSKHCHSKRVQETYVARTCIHYIHCISDVLCMDDGWRFHTKILYVHLRTTLAFVWPYMVFLCCWKLLFT